jgi:hypothetical protein
MLRVRLGSLGHVSTRRLLAICLLLAIVYFIFLWHLSNLTPGLSPSESAIEVKNWSFGDALTDPTNAPFRLLQSIIVSISPHSVISLRLASVIMASVFGFCFYKLAVGWFGKAIGLYGTFIFITLPLFVVSARQATSEIMFFAPIVLLWLFWLLVKKTKHASWLWLLLVVAGGLSLYTPGMLWWLIGAYFISRHQLSDATSEVPIKISILGLLLLMISVSPLIVSIVQHPDNFKVILALPQQLASPLDIGKHIGWMALGLFAKTGTDSLIIIGRLPVLNFLVLALMFFGAYAMRKAALAKTIGLIASILLATLLAGINNSVPFLALGLPAAIILATAGLRYLYIEWRTIFPRNPLAKNFALALLALVTLAQVYYGLHYSLIAWPNSQTVKHLYVLK